MNNISILREWKKMVTNIDGEINDLREQLARVTSAATATVGKLTHEGREKDIADKTADGAAQIVFLKNEIKRREIERLEIDRRISSIGDPVARRAIRLYTTTAAPWWKIAMRMNYSESGIRKICEKALKSAESADFSVYNEIGEVCNCEERNQD